MKKMQIIIISLVAVLVIGCVTFAILYFATDKFKSTSNKEEFNKYISQINLKQFIDLESYNSNIEKKQTQAYSNSGNIDVNVSVSGEKLIDETFEYTSKVDPINNKASSEIYIKINGENTLTLDYLKNEDLYGIKFRDLINQYIVIENNNLQDFASKFGEEINSLNIDIPNKIEIPEEYNEILKLEDLYQIIGKYLNIILQDIPEENYSKLDKQNISLGSSTVEADGYRVKINAQVINNSISKILEEIKNDTQIYNLVSTLNGEELSFEDYQEKINLVLSQNLTVDEFSDDFNISVYKVGKNAVKTEVIYGDKFEASINKTEEAIDIVINCITSEGQKIKATINKNANGRYEINCVLTESENEIVINIGYDNTLTYDSSIQVEEFSEDNYLKLNNLTSEEIVTLLPNVVKVLINKTNIEDGIIGTAVKSITQILDMSQSLQQEADESIEENVGVALNQAVEIFNSRFSVYEGEQRGASVRSLISSIEASNSMDSQHIIEYTQVNIDTTKTYNISFEKDSQGYINKVIIEEQ